MKTKRKDVVNQEAEEQVDAVDRLTKILGMIQEEQKMMEEVKRAVKQQREKDSPSIITPKLMRQYEIKTQDKRIIGLMQKFQMGLTGNKEQPQPLLSLARPLEDLIVKNEQQLQDINLAEKSNFDAQIEEECRQYLGYTKREVRKRKAIMSRNKEAQQLQEDLKLPPIQTTQKEAKPTELNTIFQRMQQNRQVMQKNIQVSNA